MATNSVIRRNYWKGIAALLAAYVSLAGVTSVLAAEVQVAPPHEAVRISDLNLSDSRGVTAAYRRLLWAAQHVCIGADSADYWVREGATPCVMQAVSQAIASVGSPELTAYAQAQPLFRLRRAEATGATD